MKTRFINWLQFFKSWSCQDKRNEKKLKRIKIKRLKQDVELWKSLMRLEIKWRKKEGKRKTIKTRNGKGWKEYMDDIHQALLSLFVCDYRIFQISLAISTTYSRIKKTIKGHRSRWWIALAWGIPFTIMINQVIIMCNNV